MRLHMSGRDAINDSTLLLDSKERKEQMRSIWHVKDRETHTTYKHIHTYIHIAVKIRIFVLGIAFAPLPPLSIPETIVSCPERATCRQKREIATTERCRNDR